MCELCNNTNTGSVSNNSIPSNLTYLGDGVYANYDGYQIELYTQNGITLNRIYLDDNTMKKLIIFANKNGIG